MHVPNAKVIVDRSNRNTASNDQYNIEFSNNSKEPDAFGQEYTFWLSDAIDSCPEYLVPKDHFIGLCRERGLVLKECLGFKQVYLNWGPEHHELLKVMGVVDEANRLQMTKQEMSIAELYDAYLFVKK